MFATSSSRLLALCVVAGCGRVAFDPTSDGYQPRCDGSLRWSTEFDEDPTTSDRNGDGVADWVLRNGGAFPIDELAKGVWSATAATSPPLDTWPAQDFETRTIGAARMRNTRADELGAVMWLNVSSLGPGALAVHVELTRERDGGQRLALVTWNVEGVGTTLAVVPGLGDGFVETVIDVDPVALTVDLEVDGSAIGTYALTEYARSGTATRAGTLAAFDGDSEFESMAVESCR